MTLGITVNGIRNQNNFKLIANGNVVDSHMIDLTDESLSCWKPKKEWKFKCKSSKKNQLLLCFSQNIAKHKLTAYLIIYGISFLIFTSTLTDIGQINWIFLKPHQQKRATFRATKMAYQC